MYLRLQCCAQFAPQCPRTLHKVLVVMAANGGSSSLAMEKIVKQAAEFITKFEIDRNRPLMCEKVVVDPSNRDRVFVTSEGIIEGAAKIHNAGFVRERTRCIAVQFPVDPAKVEAIIKYNTEEGKKDAALPEVKSLMCEYTAIGGNHTNSFCRMVSQGREISDKEFIKKVGDKMGFCSRKVNDKYVMSLDVLREQDPAYADAVENGLPWIILSREMLTEEPGAAAVIQAAENMEGTCRHVTTPPHERPLLNRRANY